MISLSMTFFSARMIVPLKSMFYSWRIQLELNHTFSTEDFQSFESVAFDLLSNLGLSGV